MIGLDSNRIKLRWRKMIFRWPPMVVEVVCRRRKKDYKKKLLRSIIGAGLFHLCMHTYTYVVKVPVFYK
jgi:hypothetical protein